MQATQASLHKLLEGKDQFIIPIYQRAYSWDESHSRQLFNDIVRVGGTGDSHFIGSVVYFKPIDSPTTVISALLVIDGQQRLTTVSLLLLALVHFLKEHKGISLKGETWQAIQESYLIHRYQEDDTKYKLLLSKKDKTTFKNLIDEIDRGDKDSKKVLETYDFFSRELGKLSVESIQSVYHGIKSLMIVVVLLESGKDNPQLIFESLNSTGLDLSQADLIRNYILMGQEPDAQNDLYNRYWYPMEQNFGENIHRLPWFIRDYLTMKQSSIPNINLVYQAYKRLLPPNSVPESIEKAVIDLHRYAKFYARIALQQEPDNDIKQKLKEISKLKIDTSYPFLLAVYGDYEEEKITKEEFVAIIGLVGSYIFRRGACGIPTNSLNKVFATLYKRVRPENYLESVKAAFLHLGGNRRFPDDAEFAEQLQVRAVYNFGAKKYLLESIENWGRREPVNATDWTIEHILPQNPDVSPEWQAELGEDWEIVRDTYLHTLGNLTLTGYNSELSDKPFKDKKATTGGFNDSPLFLNKSVQTTKQWNKAAILNRASLLAKRACEIWESPVLAADRLALYDDTKKQAEYSLDSYVHLQGDLLDLYENLEERVCHLDDSVRVECTKLYIAFKAPTNFVDVEPKKAGLLLTLNIEFENITDPRGVCRDVTNIGVWGNGDVQVKLEALSDLDYVMELIEQALADQTD